jgi:signal transduction histidine kinase/ActR/RegA family two-component response regulator
MTDIPDCCSEVCEVSAATVDGTVSSYLTNLFNTDAYPARWNCGSWTSLEGYLHIASDVGIFGAYFAIPIALIYFARKRDDFEFGALFYLIAAFILFCGTGHLIEAIIFYWPIYRFAGLVKLATAIVSWSTFFVLLRLIPRALQMNEIESLNQKLEKANSAKQNFLANMSHEIRTPMTAILGYSELLNGSEDEAERTQSIAAINRNSEHLLGLLDDILDLSKIEAGHVEVEQVPFSLQQVLQSVSDAMSHRAKQRQNTIVPELDEKLPEIVMGDPTRLRQVLFNLTGNAIKFTENGEIRVRVSADEEQPSLIRFEVIDQGIGMTAEQAAKVFVAFAQADTSTTRKYGGTGLGLTISGRLTELMGGKLSIESQPDKGTTVRFSLPLHASQEHASQGHASQGLTPSPREETTERSSVLANDRVGTELPLAGIRILYAEDGLDNQRLVRRFLERAGASCFIAENGQEAIDCIEQTEQPFDLILMDMQMPVLDGYAATRRLREMGIVIPIVAMTAHALSSSRDECFECGCDSFISKPLTSQTLIEGTLNALAASKTRDIASSLAANL